MSGDASSFDKSNAKENENEDDAGSQADEENSFIEEEFEGEGGENLIRGSSCTRSCTASSAKRFIIYKRDICGILCQIIIPLVLVIFGLWLASMPSKVQASPPRNLSTGWYEGPMKIHLSANPVEMVGDGGDITGEEVAANWPNATDFSF